MRKTLSIILSVMMILSICSFAIPVSADPEGTAINNAEEFMAMVSTAADATEITAKYYLASDITLAATYAEPFWGILDGNGHTVTVSNPMFADFSGEVKNLTINGEIYYTDMDAAAFTVLSTKGFNATNVTNNANVTVTGLGIWAAGFVCSSTETDGIPLVFTNCVNNGHIYVDSTGPEKMRVGGFGGIIDTCIFYNCTNNGNVYAKGGIPIAGGFVGRISLKVGMNTVEAYNCVNNGNVQVVETYLGTDGVSKTNGGSDAAGFFGYVGGSGNAGWYKCWGCVNNGNVDGPYRVSGFFGYVYASNSTAFADVQFCQQNGNLTYGRTDGKEDAKLYDYCGPFIAYTNSPFTTIKYCIDTGTITKREGTISLNPGLSFVGLSSADGMSYDVRGVYVLNKEQYTYFTYASAETNIANVHGIEEAEGIIVTTLEEIKSGKVAYEINELLKEDDYGWAGDNTYYFYQKIGTDNAPTTDPTHGWVVLNGTTYENGEKPVETEPVTTEAPETEAPVETTEAPVETTAEPTVDVTDDAPVVTDAPADTTAAAKSSCGSFVAGGIAIIAILGTALIIKKRD